MKTLIGISSVLLVVLTNTLFGEEERKEVEITAEVIKVEEIAEKSVDVNILRVQIKTQAGEIITARLGPVWLLEKDLKEGEQITIKGRLAEENQFMAREMSRNNETIQIRDNNYAPAWLKLRLKEEKCFYNPMNERLLRCRIEEMYVYKPSLIVEARVKSENGETVQVKFAPEWYFQNHLRVGDEIELRGSQVKSDGQIMILVREMRNIRAQQEFVLRTGEGFPLWQRAREGSQGKQIGYIGNKGGSSHDGQHDGQHGRQ
ncbi:MAG: hypothetical protein PHX21_07900 [bacterium]|nr:hypothetical protein [bacterium]